MTLAIIGGTGLEELAGRLQGQKEKKVETSYGAASVIEGTAGGSPLLFLARHGSAHDLLPHQINYRANIRALNDLGADNILAVVAVGSLKTDIKPGEFVLVDQFIDFTRGREDSFSGRDGAVSHVDMTEPYDSNLRRLIMVAADEIGMDLHRGGTYVCTEGPRFETAAEINMLRSLGADVVGMTGVPEVVLAAELKIPYAALAVVTNFAAGMAGHSLTYEGCVSEMGRRRQTVLDIFLAAARAGGLLG